MATLLGGSSPDRFEDPGPREGPLDSCATAPGGGGGVSAPSAAQQQLEPMAGACEIGALRMQSVGSVQWCAGEALGRGSRWGCVSSCCADLQRCWPEGRRLGLGSPQQGAGTESKLGDGGGRGAAGGCRAAEGGSQPAQWACGLCGGPDQLGWGAGSRSGVCMAAHCSCKQVW